jgi:ubiquitin carboxyl-terminal hydrolase 5/13
MLSQAPAPVSEESVAMLTSMGFTEAQAAKALAATDHNLERAADWLFSHAGELDAMDTDQVLQLNKNSQYSPVPLLFLDRYLARIATSCFS